MPKSKTKLKKKQPLFKSPEFLVALFTGLLVGGVVAYKTFAASPVSIWMNVVGISGKNYIIQWGSTNAAHCSAWGSPYSVNNWNTTALPFSGLRYVGPVNYNTTLWLKCYNATSSMSYGIPVHKL